MSAWNRSTFLLRIATLHCSEYLFVVIFYVGIKLLSLIQYFLFLVFESMGFFIIFYIDSWISVRNIEITIAFMIITATTILINKWWKIIRKLAIIAKCRVLSVGAKIFIKLWKKTRRMLNAILTPSMMI